METQSTNDTKNSQHTKESVSWLLLLSSVISGLAIALLLKEKLGIGLSSIPGFGIITGALGGIVAGLVQGFSWGISKKTKASLYVVLSVSTIVFFILSLRWLPIGKEFLFLLLVMLPGVVSFLAIFYIVKIITTQLTKSSVNLWLLGFLFIIGYIIIAAAMAFLSPF
jgi:hypothetical protein